jgi:hypothetical protein
MYAGNTKTADRKENHQNRCDERNANENMNESTNGKGKRREVCVLFVKTQVFWAILFLAYELSRTRQVNTIRWNPPSFQILMLKRNLH